MGLFSGLKNFLTGGAAELQLEPMELKVGQPCTVRVKVKVKDSDVKSKELYMYLRSEATCNEFKLELKDKNDDKKFDKLEITSSRISSVWKQEKFSIDQSPLYRKSSEVMLEKSIALPKDISPTLADRITWKALAGIDASGNDPDSGWSDVLIGSDFGTPVFGEWSSYIMYKLEERTLQIHFGGNFSFSVLDMEALKSKFGNMVSEQMEAVAMHYGSLIGEYLKNILSKGMPEKEDKETRFNGPRLMELMKTAHPAEWNGPIALHYLDITKINQVEYLANT